MQFADLDIRKAYSYADYYKWRFEERIELIKGKIFKMSPSPNPYHQQLTVELVRQIGNFLHRKECRVYAAPFDVRFPQKSNEDKEIFTVLQPDICVICDRSKIDSKGCLGAPDLVVEVLSPGNSSRELKKKKDIYEESCVREYWVVSPQYQNILVYVLEDDRFLPPSVKVSGDIVNSLVLPGFSLEIADLFENAEPDAG